jgi:hypothetical protein
LVVGKDCMGGLVSVYLARDHPDECQPSVWLAH